MRHLLTTWLGTCALGLAAIAMPGVAQAGPVSATIYYTTFDTQGVKDFNTGGFSGGFKVFSVDATYTGNGNSGNGTFTLSNDVGIANPVGADGIVFNPNDGRLLVSSNASSQIFDVDKTTGSFLTQNITDTAFHITVSPDHATLYGGREETNHSSLSVLTLTPSFAAGTASTKTITGDDTIITQIVFANGKVYYTGAGDPSGNGTFGTLDLATGVTTRTIGPNQGIHGLQFDPFLNELVAVGNNCVTQITLAGAIDKQRCGFSNDVLDQAAVDGQGHIFAASNNGQFFFMDYSNTSDVSAAGNFVSNDFFKTHLDDVAPLIGAGGTNDAPEPATLALLGVGLAGLGALRRRRK